ncbi:MAG: hypothetical protein ABF254_10805 [Octadecabacter sp.]
MNSHTADIPAVRRGCESSDGAGAADVILGRKTKFAACSLGLHLAHSADLYIFKQSRLLLHRCSAEKLLDAMMPHLHLLGTLS